MSRSFLLYVAGVAAATLGFWQNARADQVPGVFSTGVNDQGNLLTVGTVDPHFTIADSPGGAGAAWACSEHPAAWVADTVSSQWINPTGRGQDGLATGYYEYEETFDLTGFDPSSVSISGNWASDNSSSIWLNGVDTGWLSPSGYGNDLGKLTPFTLNAGFQPGVNTLQWNVYNAGLQTGLQVQITAATGTSLDVTTVPLPSAAGVSLATLATLSAFGAAGLLRKKLHRG